MTKTFLFSASHSAGGKIIGKNYALEISVDAVPPHEEVLLERKIQEGLIHLLESRDLGLDVDFLKGVEITDLNLLKAFWERVGRLLPEAALRSMTLHRDRTTKLTLSA